MSCVGVESLSDMPWKDTSPMNERVKFVASILLAVVKRHHPQLVLPAASTVEAILKKQGLIGRRRRVRRSAPYGDRLLRSTNAL